MKKEDIEFKIKNENGKDINCLLISSVPISESEINIMYKREDDPDDVFRYGKVISSPNSFEIKKDLTEEELITLKESFNEEIMNVANALIAQAEAE